MADRQTPENPMARAALFTTLVPFLVGLAMLGLKYEVGPRALFYWATQLGGFFHFGSMVLGSGFLLIAYSRHEGGRDWRIGAAALLLVLSLLETYFFLRPV